MGKLERLFHRWNWNSVNNLWMRVCWLLRSYWHVDPNHFMDGWEMSIWDIDFDRITFKTGMPWGRIHPNMPFQVMGLNSVLQHVDQIDLAVIPNHQTVYHNGNTYNPEIDAGCIYSDQEFLYGEFELECTLANKGQWLAFWLLGDHGWPPEIDIFEFFPSELKISDRQRKLSTTIHYDDAHYQDGSSIRIPNEGGRSFFGLRWLPDSLEFFYNGRSYLKLNDSKLVRKYFNKPMRIIVGTGVKEDYNDDVFDSTFKVHNIIYKSI